MGTYEFVDDVVGGSIPREFIPACDKGFQEAIKEGRLIGFPIVGVRACINDGASHDVDSSEQAFKTAALMGFREAYAQAGAVVLEPIMKLETQAPEEFQGSVMGQINQRRGMIINSGTNEGYAIIEAEVPLNEMFGYSTDLRSATQGKGEFTMEFLKYSPVPRNVQEEMVKKFQEKKAVRRAKVNGHYSCHPDRVVHVFTCILLVCVVLIQSGKGAEISASFSGSSQTVFGSSGGANFFVKLTAGAAAVVMVTSLLLTTMGSGEGRKSLFDNAAPAAATTKPVGAPSGLPVTAPPVQSPATPPAMPRLRLSRLHLSKTSSIRLPPLQRKPRDLR